MTGGFTYIGKTHIRQVPSFFGTNMTGDPQGGT